MLIDDVTIHVLAGRGGNGAVAFNKTKMALGPAGGDGGHGGNIFFEGVSDLSALRQFQYRKEIKAENGVSGQGYFKSGRDGNDSIIRIPIGTVIYNLDLETTEEITKIGQRILIAKGGRGGRGNMQFKSSTNTTPRECEPGRKGQEYRIRLELKMIADVGLIGLPNAGKSSLINELTAAKAKVANYPFTTLEPNLGAFGDVIIADIPGLIAGASSGRGLGLKFLRHIERTKVIFHLVSAESKAPIKDYRTIRRELKKYSDKLAEKPEFIFISKSDQKNRQDQEKLRKKIHKINPNVQLISIYDYDSIENVKKLLYGLSNKKRSP